ncbi:hypothetical protein BDZ89DRAFT_1137717 [Hymenopellis radicata]|nr:hypothetical protein BDZ89DRAFT_1137717 [Hymenopellis radicata]
MSPAVGLPLRPRVFGPFVSILTVATSFIIGLKVADIPAGPPSAHNSQVVHFPQQRPSRVRYHRTFSRALWFRYQPPQGRAPSGTDQSFSQRKPVRFYVFAVEDGSDLRSLDALSATHVGGLGGIGPFNARDLEGRGSWSVTARRVALQLDPSQVRSLRARTLRLCYVKSSDGAIRLDTPFSRLLGKAGTTPLLCSSSQSRRDPVQDSCWCRSHTQRAVHPRQFSFQLPLWQGIRREGLPIEGFCVAAGIPSTEKAVEIRNLTGDWLSRVVERFSVNGIIRHSRRAGHFREGIPAAGVSTRR